MPGPSRSDPTFNLVESESRVFVACMVKLPPAGVIVEACWTMNFRNLLKGQVGEVQSLKYGLYSWNIKFGRDNHGALPASCSEYFQDLDGRSVSARRGVFNDNGFVWDAGKSQPVRL